MSQPYRLGPGLQSLPGRLEVGLGRVEVFGQPTGSPAVRWMVTFQSQRHGIRSVARRIRPDALIAFEHRIVAETDCSGP